MTDLGEFEPNRETALEKLRQVRPSTYAKTRNFLNGRVTKLSPWITHGLLSLKEVAEHGWQTEGIGLEDKLIFELGWREFFQHVHRQVGDAILRDMRPGVWQGKYARELPEDFLNASTGVKPIDWAVRSLRKTGYLHNHARMWVASYLVHLRKVSWRTGADWMYGHLLDGDLASNHLSWQWVAGTFSHKPYLFNAENVQKYAPELACKGSVIDTSYEDLEDIARSNKTLLTLGSAARRVDRESDDASANDSAEYPLQAWPDQAALLSLIGTRRVDQEWGKKWAGRPVRLVHPWALRAKTAGTYHLGVLAPAFHAKFPWSEKRWAFVLQAMASACDAIVVLDAENLQNLRTALQDETTGPSAVEIDWTAHPIYSDLHTRLKAKQNQPDLLLPEPKTLQTSFSKFYRKACDMAGSLDNLIDNSATTR